MIQFKHLTGRARKPVATLAAMAGLGALAGLPSPAMAAPVGCHGDLSGDSWLWVEVAGLRNDKGLVAITVYSDDSRKFLVKHGSEDVVRVPAESGVLRTCVKLPSNGVWALAVYHDEDGSRKINRSGLGIPTEGFGFSNNPSTVAGLPLFRSVRLNVPKPGLTTRINMRYP